MNGATASLILGASGLVVIAIALVRNDPGMFIPAVVFIVAGLLVEALRAETPAEAAWRRNHQARPTARRRRHR